MYDHTFYKQVQISRSDIRPHVKWAVSLVILHMVTSIFLRALCGYIWVNILTLSPRGDTPGTTWTNEMKLGWMDGWMNGVLGHFHALSRLNWAGDNLG